MKRSLLLVLAGLMVIGVSTAFAEGEKDKLGAIPEQAQFNENKAVKDMVVVPAAQNPAQPAVNPAAAAAAVKPAVAPAAAAPAAAPAAAKPAVNPSDNVATKVNPAGKTITNHGVLQSGQGIAPVAPVAPAVNAGVDVQDVKAVVPEEEKVK